MDTGIVTGTSREEDPSHSAPAIHPSQNASTSLPSSSSRSALDDSPFTPEKNEKVVKVDDFDSFLDFLRSTSLPGRGLIQNPTPSFFHNLYVKTVRCRIVHES